MKRTYPFFDTLLWSLKITSLVSQKFELKKHTSRSFTNSAIFNYSNPPVITSTVFPNALSLPRRHLVSSGRRHKSQLDRIPPKPRITHLNTGASSIINNISAKNKKKTFNDTSLVWVRLAIKTCLYGHIIGANDTFFEPNIAPSTIIMNSILQLHTIPQHSRNAHSNGAFCIVFESKRVGYPIPRLACK